jgi:hypothetical protein
MLLPFERDWRLLARETFISHPLFSAIIFQRKIAGLSRFTVPVIGSGIAVNSCILGLSAKVKKTLITITKQVHIERRQRAVNLSKFT